MKNDQKGFGVVEVLLAIIAVTLLVGVGFYIVNANKNKNSNGTTQTTNSTSPTTTQTKVHTAQEAVTFVQKTYDDYLTALNNANNDTNNTQPVAQVGLAAVKDNLSSDLYAKAAAVTQATPFSCTAQYVADKYTATLSSNNTTRAVVALSISNGGGTSTSGMSATVDLTSLKITSVICPS